MVRGFSLFLGRSSCACSVEDSGEVDRGEGVVLVSSEGVRSTGLYESGSKAICAGSLFVPTFAALSGLIATGSLFIGGFEAESEAYRRVNGLSGGGAALNNVVGLVCCQSVLFPFTTTRGARNELIP
jgi:hypothetical protein